METAEQLPRAVSVKSARPVRLGRGGEPVLASSLTCDESQLNQKLMQDRELRDAEEKLLPLREATETGAESKATEPQIW